MEDNQLKWDIESQSLFTDMQAEQLEKEILATRETWTDDEKGMVTEVAYLLSCTLSVEVVGEKQPIGSVLRFIEGIKNRPVAADLLVWRLKIPYKLLNMWRAEFNAGQDLFSDPAQLPTNMLSQSQQEELKDKNSPLVGVG